MASNIVVLGFENQYGAEAMLDDVYKWQEEGIIEVEDAVVASRGHGGDVQIQQTRKSSKGKFALRGGGIGLVAGTLVGGPILGLVAGVTAGALKGKSKDKKQEVIDEKLVRQISDWVQPERSALFLLVKQANADEIQAKLKPLRAKVLTTTLAPEQEQRLRQALAQEEYD